MNLSFEQIDTNLQKLRAALAKVEHEPELTVPNRRPMEPVVDVDPRD